MNFLPDNYKEPVVSNYMKFEDGPNTFRVLSPAIVGMEFWKTTDDGRRPVRRKMDEKIRMDELEINDKTGELEMPKHFWSFVVWNRGAEKIQILEITQKGVQKGIKALINSSKWGDPKEYDITVTREGSGLDTSYSVMPEPKEKIDEGVTKLFKDMNIDLEALYSGEDPFISGEKDENEKKSKLAEKVAEEADDAIPF